MRAQTMLGPPQLLNLDEGQYTGGLPPEWGVSSWALTELDLSHNSLGGAHRASACACA